MLKVEYLSLKEKTPGKGYWDQTFLDDLLFSLTDSDRQVVVIPGAYQGDIIPQINDHIKQYQKVLVFVTSDEEGKFDCEKLEHPDMIHYRQYGYCENLFPIGYTPQARYWLRRYGLQKKEIATFFAGQINSAERQEMLSNAVYEKNSVLFCTNGFAKGLKHPDYFSYLNSAQKGLAPGGWVSPDSFRLYELLEAGATPVMDQKASEYINRMFPTFPEVGLRETYQAWWLKQKMLIRQQIKEDLDIHEAMTIVIPTSPISSHPSTEIIDQTIASIRHHTSMDIIITIDGVRPEQEEMRAQYVEYIDRLLWKCNFEYQNVMPLLFYDHKHQSGMMKEALKHVKTPLVMYVEHDTPLVTDEEIDWGLIVETLMKREGDLVRFHYEAVIPEPHKYLMLEPLNDKFLKTRQWSQRPHVARTDFYREVMRFFSKDANCFLEDLLYGRCLDGKWEDWRLLIYTPDEKNIKRSLNLDGRGSDRKFEAEQKW